ncbi:MAG TPA: hypothetical protein PL000_22205, partial [Anaerolineales bacterium]|nr:hypothetical protein [Anaerolineales bacterium]
PIQIIEKNTFKIICDLKVIQMDTPRTSLKVTLEEGVLRKLLRWETANFTDRNIIHLNSP